MSPEKFPISHSVSQIDLKRSIFERFFISFVISLFLPLRLAFPRIQILNSWSPNRL
ncbi:hypothetical protein MTR67_038658 [Solanum verrucosum]|uniref:Uncharacterized protein n=1 Tax=Solanum verrucosum TaxID=315347 RepID=A0AAF0ZPP3_SOLVR|nr:hypothetical protein MTR67_038658 [Solanum verrucosum]